MQLLTNELREYGMQLMTTKCLNTAVMMWYLFLGERDDDFRKAAYCDSKSVKRRGLDARKTLEPRRYAASEWNPVNVVERFGKDLLSTVQDDPRVTDPDALCGMRTLFYVMMTDAELPLVKTKTPPHKSKKISEDDDNNDDRNGNGKKSQSSSAHHPSPTPPTGVPKQFFPGHVYVIEKVWIRPDRNRYNLYQSYINNYTLNGHAQNNHSYSMSQAGAQRLVDNLEMMYASPAWDERYTRFWKQFTHVDTTRYEGYQFSQQSFFCYRKANTTNCTANLERFLREKLGELDALLRSGQAQEDGVYGDSRLYTGSQNNVAIQILTNGQMKAEMEEMLQKL